jgi:Flp pilus assembly protein TadG
LDGQDHDNEKNKHAEEDTMIIKSEKGVSAVEFALLAPFLFVLTFGIIEFGILLFDKAVITNASREGARAAIVYIIDATATPPEYSPMSIPDVQKKVTDYANDYLINLGGVANLVIPPKVVYDGGTPTSGKDVTVTVAYHYNFLVFSNLIPLLSGGAFDGTIPLEGRTVMRME